MDWGPGFVQSQFTGLLNHRRKRYPAALRDVLGQVLGAREQADAAIAPVSQTQAARALGRARGFVSVVGGREGAAT